MNLLEKAIKHFSSHPEFFSGLKPGAIMTIEIIGVGAYTVTIEDDNKVTVKEGYASHPDILFRVTPEAEEELIMQQTKGDFGRKLIGYYLNPKNNKRVEITPKIPLIKLAKKGYVKWSAQAGFKII